MKLRLKDGVVDRLVWSAPDSRIAPFCSLCQAHIPDDVIPLRMWSPEGWTVHFCERCEAEAVEVIK
jgi:hypothetical protein